ncbi:MAG: hypothetical protein U1F48_00725 [Burkholderiales bacterium]
MTTYRVVITGIKAGHNREEVLQRLAAMFKQPVERLRALVTGSRTVVKRGAEMALAAKMQATIEAAGCDVVVEPEVSDGPLASATQTTASPNVDVRGAPEGVAPTIGQGMRTPSPSLGKSKLVRYGGGFVLLFLAFGIVVTIYAFLHDSAKPTMNVSAPSEVREQRAPPPTMSASVPSEVREQTTSPPTTTPTQPPTAVNVDERFSPGERLALTLANTEWSCPNGSLEFNLFPNEFSPNGMSPMWSSNAKGKPKQVGFWIWKNQRGQQGADDLKDDEIGFIESITTTSFKPAGVMRIDLSSDGTRLSLIDIVRGIRTDCEMFVDHQTRAENKKRIDQELRTLMLQSKIAPFKPKATPPAPPTAASEFQAMEKHQDACQAQSNIGCVAVCETTKNQLVKLTGQLSLNPQSPIPDQFRGVVANLKNLCLSKGK